MLIEEKTCALRVQCLFKRKPVHREYSAYSRENLCTESTVLIQEKTCAQRVQCLFKRKPVHREYSAYSRENLCTESTVLIQEKTCVIKLLIKSICTVKGDEDVSEEADL